MLLKRFDWLHFFVLMIFCSLIQLTDYQLQILPQVRSSILWSAEIFNSSVLHYSFVHIKTTLGPLIHILFMLTEFGYSHLSQKSTQSAVDVNSPEGEMIFELYECE